MSVVTLDFDRQATQPLGTDVLVGTPVFQVTGVSHNQPGAWQGVVDTFTGLTIYTKVPPLIGLGPLPAISVPAFSPSMPVAQGPSYPTDFETVAIPGDIGAWYANQLLPSVSSFPQWENIDQCLDWTVEVINYILALKRAEQPILDYPEFDISIPFTGYGQAVAFRSGTPELVSYMREFYGDIYLYIVEDMGNGFVREYYLDKEVPVIQFGPITDVSRTTIAADDVQYFQTAAELWQGYGLPGSGSVNLNGKVFVQLVFDLHFSASGRTPIDAATGEADNATSSGANVIPITNIVVEPDAVTSHFTREAVGTIFLPLGTLDLEANGELIVETCDDGRLTLASGGLTYVMTENALAVQCILETLIDTMDPICIGGELNIDLDGFRMTNLREQDFYYTETAPAVLET